jgi:hypothetical protein
MPVETFIKRNSLSIFPLAKPRQKTAALFKIYELFIYGYTHYITNPNVPKIATPYPWL